MHTHTWIDCGIEIPTGAYGEIDGICPQCGPEHRNGKKTLSINTDEGLWNCHRCGWKGKLSREKVDKPFQLDPLYVWNRASSAPDTHPYLKKKQIPSHGLRVSGRGELLIPMKDAKGEIRSTQKISPDSGKRYAKGISTKGLHFTIGPETEVVYLCEGYATGASIHAATHKQVIVTFDAGNLSAVSKAIKNASPQANLIIAADNDTRTKGNPGLSKARAAAEAIGATVVYPEGGGDFNDLHVKEGLEAVKEALETPRISYSIWDNLVVKPTKSGGVIPESCLANVIEILANDPRWQGCIAFDELSNEIILLKQPPGNNLKDKFPRAWRDEDEAMTVAWLNRSEYVLRVSEVMVHSAARVVARMNAFHPIRDWLDSLKWDGINRLDTWLHKYAGAEDNRVNGAKDDPVNTAIGRKWLVSAIARAYEPGCKVDTMLVLEGDQGIQKSTLFQVLANGYFTDDTTAPGTKEAAERLQGVWIVEYSELAALTRSEVESIKSFISRREDRFRPSYGRNVVTRPRQCVFAGTTNADTYLRDETGNRRFWPVKCGKINIEALKRDRDQLWAEALHLYRHGERWWLDRNTEAVIAKEQAARSIGDPWDNPIRDYVLGKEFVTTKEILENVFHIPLVAQGKKEQSRVAQCLRRQEWKAGKERGTKRDNKEEDRRRDGYVRKRLSEMSNFVGDVEDKLSGCF